MLSPRAYDQAPRYSEDLDDQDDGILARALCEVAHHSLSPCQGCGEHRLFDERELGLVPLIDIQFCFRCRERLEAEASAERGKTQ